MLSTTESAIINDNENNICYVKQYYDHSDYEKDYYFDDFYSEELEKLKSVSDYEDFKLRLRTFFVLKFDSDFIDYKQSYYPGHSRIGKYFLTIEFDENHIMTFMIDRESDSYLLAYSKHTYGTPYYEDPEASNFKLSLKDIVTLYSVSTPNDETLLSNFINKYKTEFNDKNVIIDIYDEDDIVYL